MVKVYKSNKGKEKNIELYNRVIKRWDIDLKEIDLSTTYGTTHIITCGDTSNKPLLMFHGVGDNSSLMWIYNAKELAKHFYIIAVDTIGGPGKSEPNENYNKNFNQVQWVDEIISELKISKPNILGVSNGAAIVQNYLAKRYDKVDKCISISGTLLCEETVNNQIKKMLKIFMPEALFPNKKSIHKLIHKLTGDNHKVITEDEELMEFWLCLLKYFNNMSMSYHKYIGLTSEEIAKIKDKLFLMIGDRDPLSYYPRSIELLDEHKINYEIYTNAGHALNHEKAEEINSDIIKYLS